ncbi:TIGR02206 family membrane protein [Salinicoccus kekensis]|uniref:Hypothetical integral membrane protein (TIGR02206 family) n=1 Tax=Salinicoccus kekensis TaxID=714307 RepID=A0A285ULV4_9STAP|nr:TIGR02206 family membrane protein [Salinicoccus kekensis]SOC42792.1 hypothetical integral membrane protein (TIGR02206 family) [Salinicoccus kekensis]
MDRVINPAEPFVEPGDVSYFAYLVLLTLCFYVIYRMRSRISGNAQKVLFVFLIISIGQRILINTWYLINDDYSLAYSLPFQICRVVIWLIIIQYFVRKDFLNQAIFYIGLFAYAAFIYPIGIHPVWHMAGWAFFILHAANVLFPFAMHYAAGFVPSLKGVFQAYLIFIAYFFFVYFLNPVVGGNYFFINNRPFFHEMGEGLYITVNLAGTLIGFLAVYAIIRAVIHIRRRSATPGT